MPTTRYSTCKCFYSNIPCDVITGPSFCKLRNTCKCVRKQLATDSFFFFILWKKWRKIQKYIFFEWKIGLTSAILDFDLKNKKGLGTLLDLPTAKKDIPYSYMIGCFLLFYFFGSLCCSFKHENWQVLSFLICISWYPATLLMIFESDLNRKLTFILFCKSEFSFLAFFSLCILPAI